MATKRKKRQPRDPTKILVGITHGRSGYRRGCNCDICVGAEQEYQQQRKCQGLQPRNGQSVGTVTQLRAINGGRDDDETDDDVQFGGVPPRVAAKTRTIGKVERLTIEECEGLSIAKERPGMVAQAAQLARIMDNPKQIGLWPTTSRQLTQILNDLRGNSKKKSKGRLAKVQNMTSNRVAN